MISEDYVSFETAKLLKEKGFSEWCFKCYGVAVLHNGADISFDEECELKDEGRENEIEYVEGGGLYDYGCNNRDKDAKVWAAPTLWVAMNWLREKYNVHIGVLISYQHIPRKYEVHIMNTEKYEDIIVNSGINFNSNKEACEAGIKYFLEHLI